MSAYDYSREEFAAVFTELQKTYQIYGPKRFAGRGRFSDTDLIRYAPLASLDELELAEKSSLSPKSLVFPADETIFHFNDH